MEGKSEKLPKPLLTNDLVMIDIAPAGNYMFKVNNRDTRSTSPAGVVRQLK